MAVLVFGLYLVAALSSLRFCNGDTPANCTYDDVIGSWRFYLSENSYTSHGIDCSKAVMRSTSKTLDVMLSFPDSVVDSEGNVGTWTMVYNQGFSIILGGIRYLAFSDWKHVSAKKTVSLCHRTRSGWFHDVYSTSFPVKNWGCFRGLERHPFVEKPNESDRSPPLSVLEGKRYTIDENLINDINTAQSSWKATVYKHYNLMSIASMRRRRGSFRSNGFKSPSPSPVKNETLQQASLLPKEFDWRSVDGVNYVSPVRNQGACGSCYAFASMAMLEARIRIATKNREQPVLSTQNIVDCGNYSQGCEGGYPYLVAGSYATDFGNVDEKCLPYTGKDGVCPLKEASCKRYYVKHYDYVGGFFGGCNEALMRVDLVKQGPIAVGIDVLADFEHYKGGIYHHTGLTGRFDPIEPMNHAVLIVGYGQDKKTGEKFWIVKNSWGEEWGEKGYFRIRRGSDEIAIESLGFNAVPHV